ncbi:hypothetical protein [Staphylococcus ratti]|uniref:Uncharacterized protein n=1 Tax=Staphylococcus ratti TaxID=2892440 RepID=A0ABY3PCG1_9STAP|nr:hypothetical protein [Staphylococcus ratti]UEX89908.1 hypothetical protein LN051_10170 [Staphylococcus ratti]
MIDYRDYSEEYKVFMISIGALDWYKIRKSVVKTIEKLTKPNLPDHYSYTFVDVNEVTVLLIKTHSQFIPDLIRALCKKNIAVYEVKHVEDKTAWFD